MTKYYVIKSTNEMDEAFEVEALSLEEAFEVAKVRYEKSLLHGEYLHVFKSTDSLFKDENSRIILPDCEIMSLSLWKF